MQNNNQYQSKWSHVFVCTWYAFVCVCVRFCLWTRKGYFWYVRVCSVALFGLYGKLYNRIVYTSSTACYTKAGSLLFSISTYVCSVIVVEFLYNTAAVSTLCIVYYALPYKCTVYALTAKAAAT